MIEITVIIPTLNEEKYIGNLLDGLYLHNNCRMEVLVFDGGSTDQTKQIVLNKAYPNLKLIENESKFVSYAFNEGYHLAKGKFIALLGAHAVYPPKYLDTALAYLEGGECDAVGGPIIQIGKNNKGKAIAYAMSTKFGVGDTAFRTEKKKMYVESVAFAVYKRSIFEQVGLLDTSLKRNQDDELHYRINAAGFKILMVPELSCNYFVRDSFLRLFHQYFEYGLYKPLVFKRVKSGMRLRHLIPSLFLCYIILLIPLTYLCLNLALFIPLCMYFICAVYFTMVSHIKVKNWIYIPIAYLILHLSYGTGFLLGLSKYFEK